MRYQVCLFVVLVSVFSTKSAHAYLEYCNASDDEVAVAVAYQDRGVWTSRGWFLVQPRSCSMILSGDLTGEHYYLHAQSGGIDLGNPMPGSGRTAVFCTQERSFTQRSHNNCRAVGMTATRFFRVDRGSSPSIRVSFASNRSTWRRMHANLSFTCGGDRNCDNTERLRREARNRCNEYVRDRNSGSRQVDLGSVGYEIYIKRNRQVVRRGDERHESRAVSVEVTCRWRER